MNKRTKENSHPEGCIYEHFAYLSHSAAYPNSADMNELSAIIWGNFCLKGGK